MSGFLEMDNHRVVILLLFKSEIATGGGVRAKEIREGEGAIYELQ